LGNRPRRGFTLVELLVVIAIIGILVALLLPAVQAAREAARRTQCANNSKQLGIGLHNYHDTFKIFPPAGMHQAANITAWNGYGSGNKQLGVPWAGLILPFIEQGNLFTKINYTVEWQNNANAIVWGTNVPGFICPSDPFAAVQFNDSNGNWARGNYGANLGIGNSAAWNIYRNQNSAQRGILGYQQSANMGGIVDGTSNTVLLWELRAGSVNTDPRGVWGIPRFGSSGVSGCDNWGDCYGINEGYTPHCCGDDIQGCTDNQPVGLGCWNGGDGQGGSKSQHPGGVHALLGDASTRFISQSLFFGNNGDTNSRGPGRQISTASGGETINGDF